MMRASTHTEEIINTWLELCTAGNYEIRAQLQHQIEQKPKSVIALYYAVLARLKAEEDEESSILKSFSKKKSYNLSAILRNSSPVELGRILEGAVDLLEQPSNGLDKVALQRLKYELLVTMNLYVLNGNDQTKQYEEMIEAIAANYDDGEKQDTKRLIRAGVPRPNSWYFQNVEPGSQDEQASNHENEISELNMLISEKPAVDKVTVDMAIRLFLDEEYINAEIQGHLNDLWELCQQDFSLFKNDQLIRLATRIEQSINPFISELYEVVTKNLKLDSVTKLRYLSHIQVLRQAFKEKESQIVDAMLERLSWVPDEVLKDLRVDQHRKTLTNSKWLQASEATNKFINQFVSENGYRLDEISLTQIIKYLLYIGSKGSPDQKRQIYERLPIKTTEKKADWLDDKLTEWQLICPEEIAHIIRALVNTKVIETNLESRNLYNLLININRHDKDNILQKSFQMASLKGMITTKEEFNIYVRLSSLFGEDQKNIEILPLILTVCDDSEQIAEIQDVYSSLKYHLDEIDFSMLNQLLKNNNDYFKDYDSMKGFFDQLLLASKNTKKMELVRLVINKSISENINPVENLDFVLNKVMKSKIKVTSQYIINHLLAAEDMKSFKRNVLYDAAAVSDRPILSILYQFFDNETVNRIVSDIINEQQNDSVEIDDRMNTNINNLMNWNEIRLMSQVTHKDAQIIHLVMLGLTLGDELNVATCLKASIKILKDVDGLLKSIRAGVFTPEQLRDFNKKLTSLINQLREQIHTDKKYSSMIGYIIKNHLSEIANPDTISKQASICFNMMKIALKHAITYSDEAHSLINSTTELLIDLETPDKTKEETAILELVNDGLKLLLNDKVEPNNKKAIQRFEKSLENESKSLRRKHLVKSFWSSFMGLFGLVFDSAKRLSHNLAEQSNLFGKKSKRIEKLSSDASKLRGNAKRS